MLDSGLDTMDYSKSVFEIAPSGGMLQQLFPGVAIGIFIDSHCVVYRVNVQR